MTALRTQTLWSGIVPPERAGRVVARLMQPDMWSGWGIRTLSSKHPSYNPYSYQNGAVWPHDNGLIAQGLIWRSGEEARFEVLKGDAASIARRDVIVWSDLLRRGPVHAAAEERTNLATHSAFTGRAHRGAVHD